MTPCTILSSDRYDIGRDEFRVDTVAVGASRFRYTVRRNSHDDQSTAVAEAWDGRAWRPVASLPFPLWPDACKRHDADYDLVVDELHRRTMGIVGITDVGPVGCS